MGLKKVPCTHPRDFGGAEHEYDLVQEPDDPGEIRTEPLTAGERKREGVGVSRPAPTDVVRLLQDAHSHISWCRHRHPMTEHEESMLDAWYRDYLELLKELSRA